MIDHWKAELTRSEQLFKEAANALKLLISSTVPSPHDRDPKMTGSQDLSSPKKTEEPGLLRKKLEKRPYVKSFPPRTKLIKKAIRLNIRLS